MSSEEAEPGSDEVEKFWELAKFHARLNPVPSYFGPTALEAVIPPAFTLGDDSDGADAALRTLITDGHAVLETPREDFASDDDLPSEGALGIVLDGAGHPHALVETAEVSVSDQQVIERLRVVYSS